LTSGPARARRTPLYDEHVAAGAKMVDFSGWAMPLYYDGIVAEHLRVRRAVGLLDVSHMGEFLVTGGDALRSLELLTVNRVGALSEGRVQYTAMCYDDGGFVDDLLIYRFPDRFMLVVNAANREKDLEWIREHLVGDAAVTDVTEETALIAVQGPSAEPLLQKVTSGDLSRLRYYAFDEFPVAGREALVSRTGYTGEDGFEIYVDPGDAPAIWNALLEEGREIGVAPAGLGARDTLRLEMGYCLYGNDIDETRTPVEAGLMWITKLDKGKFVGREAIARRVEEGPRERLAGFVLSERGIPRAGQRILAGGSAAGEVTSGTFSPSLERGIGMGYVSVEASGGLEIEIRGRPVAASRVRLPFYRGGTVRRKVVRERSNSEAGA